MIENRIRLTEVKSISVKREERFRKELDMSFVRRLAKQIQSHRLINPILVDDKGFLVAGENRLSAFLLMQELGWDCPFPEYEGWTKIPTRLAKNLNQFDLDIIELSENLGRSDMTWQNKAAGMLKLFDQHKEEGEEITLGKLADNLNLSSSYVYKMVDLARNLDDPQIAECDNWKTAMNILVRKKERAISSIVDDISIEPPKESKRPERGEPGYKEEQDPLPLDFNDIELPKAESPAVGKPIVDTSSLSFRGECQSFLEFAKEYNGPKFNLIHLDPPYGINLHKSNTMQKSGRGQYEDTRDLFFEITGAFFENQNRLCSSSCHMLFWHSAPDREVVCKMLQDNGWVVWKYPVIWHKSCNTGLFPDSNRGPRHTYEMATFASRGDRKIVKLVSDSYSGAATKSSGHESEKPVEMLEHFFTMLVDDSTSIFDPTGGSGNAILAAQNKGARRGLFLEVESYYPDTFNKKQLKIGADNES